MILRQAGLPALGPLRRVVVPLIDVVAAALAIYLAFALRFEDVVPVRALQWLPIALMPIVVRPLINKAFGLYRHSWRHVSVPELLQLTLAIGTGTALMLGVWGLLTVVNFPPASGFPRSFWILESAISLVTMGVIRLTPRILSELTSTPTTSDGRLATILYGAGDAGAMMARGAVRQPTAGVRPVAFLDDDPFKWNRIHAGVPVRGGLDALAAVAESTKAELLLITMPTAPGAVIRAIADAAFDLGLKVRTVPSLDEMLNGTFAPEMIRPLKLEDLLRRPPVSAAALSELATDLAGETILVTGAGGSIGSELARQLASLAPRSLVLLDRAEGPLYDLQRELETRQRRGPLPTTNADFRIGDVANPRAMARLIAELRPSVIFHAAAYKHVSVMEEHPASAIEVNVGGTKALLDAAEGHGVERFVLVSTDKAVDPSSVMGATKRLAELLVAEYSERTGRPWVSVRFGNVLGSSGSVVPIFQKQLDNGEPLTVTHKDMTRFFMTISEAVHLILQAATLARPGALFVLDMGEPVRILDLAKDLLRLRGLHRTREPIVFTGLRPGEKLHERLFYADEQVETTEHEKIFRAHSPRAFNLAPRDAADGLLRLLEQRDNAAIRRSLMAALAAVSRTTSSRDTPRRVSTRRVPVMSEPAPAKVP